MFFKINFSLFIDKRKIMCIFTPPAGFIRKRKSAPVYPITRKIDFYEF